MDNIFVIFDAIDSIVRLMIVVIFFLIAPTMNNALIVVLAGKEGVLGLILNELKKAAESVEYLV